MSDTMNLALGNLNQGWGVCGFTSTFYAMYQANPAVRGWLVNASEVYSVLYEITDYLQALQAAQSPLLKDITAFTRSFGPPYDKFTIDNYIREVETQSENTRKWLAYGNDQNRQQNDKALRGASALFGIAMPPQAVADYIERMWKWKATITEFGASGTTEDAIIGVKNPTNTAMTMYNGLCHYLYRGGGVYYSWGERFDSLAKAADHVKATYAVVYSISIRKY